MPPKRSERSRSSSSDGQPRAGARPGGPARSPLLLAAVPAFVIVVLALTPRVRANPVLVLSFGGACSVLLVWLAALLVTRRHHPSSGELEIVLRGQHYIQAICQVAVYAYWGWYWRPVYDMTVLFVAQLAFAYGFAMLLAWSRGQRYALGFGPVPIILSINLFIWFRDDWFYLQFLMIAVGFLGKELVRWRREGRLVHIFNPSAFALGLFSLVLIATGTTDLTWGREIASYLTFAPRIYLFLFAVGLVVMYFFAITLVAGAAAVTLFGLSALYFALTGVPYFIDSEIPAAVFLGLHLLITDPSTSPRTPLGKTLFGVLYGLGVFALYAILTATGAPTFYDKLLCVPLLNLSVRGIDHLLRTYAAGEIPALRPEGAGVAVLPAERSPADGPRRRVRVPFGVPTRLNLAAMAVWTIVFAGATATGRTDGRHVGDTLPFWEIACAEGRRNACERLLSIEASYCGDNSAWACNELGVYHVAGRIVETDREAGRRYFARACELRFQPACLNLIDPAGIARADPKPLDLRLVLREGGQNLLDSTEPELYRRACDHGFTFACQRTGRGP